jgi:cobalamin transport system ATP-binding protein
MPQSETPQENVPVLEYVLFGRYAHLGAFEPEGTTDRVRVEAALRAVDLWPRRDSGVLELSGGERQRVLLARALAQDAPLLLLDEPTAHLDIGHQLDLLHRVQALARDSRTAVVVALHDLNLAARYVERIVVVDRGRLVDDGTPSAVLSPDLLRDVWGVDAELRSDPASGQPYLIPRLARRQPRPVRGDRGPVHVVGGGGTATPVLRALFAGGWRTTAGVLPLFDTDTETARALGTPTVVGLPFAPIAPDRREAVRPLLHRAVAVVVAPIPVGPANLANLEELEALDPGRIPLLLLEPDGWAGRDFTGGAATAVRDRLRARGARAVASVAEVLRALELALAPGRAGDGAPVAEAADP